MGDRKISTAARAGLFFATLATIICLLIAYTQSNKGGCDGGLCLIPIVLGCVAAAVAWPIVFLVVWGLVRLVSGRD